MKKMSITKMLKEVNSIHGKKDSFEVTVNFCPACGKRSIKSYDADTLTYVFACCDGRYTGEITERKG